MCDQYSSNNKNLKQRKLVIASFFNLIICFYSSSKPYNTLSVASLSPSSIPSLSSLISKYETFDTEYDIDSSDCASGVCSIR